MFKDRFSEINTTPGTILFKYRFSDMSNTLDTLMFKYRFSDFKTIHWIQYCLSID